MLDVCVNPYMLYLSIPLSMQKPLSIAKPD